MPAVLHFLVNRILFAALVAIVGAEMRPRCFAEPSGEAAPIAGREVLIEAVVVEITPGRSDFKKYGRSEAGDYSFGLSLVKSPHATLLGSWTPVALTDAAGRPLRGLGYVARLQDDFGTIINELENESRAKIVQRPRIQTSEGQPAMIHIGETQPYGSRPDGGWGSTPSAVQIAAAAVLEVVPFFRSNRLVVLDMRLQTEHFERDVWIKNNGQAQITSAKDGQTEVEVNENEAVLLGGWARWKEKRSAPALQFPKELPGVACQRPWNSLRQSDLMVLVHARLLGAK